MAPATQQAYTYVLSNPARWTDPTGRYVYEESPDDPYLDSPWLQHAATRSLGAESSPFLYDARALARGLWGEQKGTWPRQERMAAAGYVYVSRVKNTNSYPQDESLPHTIWGILRDPDQVQGYRETDPSPDEAYYGDWPLALEIAELVLRGRIKDVTGGACFEGDVRWLDPNDRVYQGILWHLDNTPGFEYVLIPTWEEARAHGYGGKLMVVTNIFYLKPDDAH